MPPQRHPSRILPQRGVDRDRGCSFRPFVFLPTLATAKDAFESKTLASKVNSQTLCRGSATLQSGSAVFTRADLTHTEVSVKNTLGFSRKAGSRRGLSLRSGFGLRAIHRITTQISRTLLERTLCIGCPSLLCDLLPGAAGLGTSQSIPPRPTKGGRRVHTLFEKTTCLSSQPCGMTFETFARRARCAVAVDPSS